MNNNKYYTYKRRKRTKSEVIGRGTVCVRFYQRVSERPDEKKAPKEAQKKDRKEE